MVTRVRDANRFTTPERVVRTSPGVKEWAPAGLGSTKLDKSDRLVRCSAVRANRFARTAMGWWRRGMARAELVDRDAGSPGAPGRTGGSQVSIRRVTWRGAKIIAATAAVAVIGTACVNSGSTAPNKSAEPIPSGSTIQPIVPSEPASPVTVTFSSWVGDSPQMKKFAADFHTLHPNITIQFQNVSADNSTQKLTTQIAGGAAPDAAFVDASAVEQFASRGALVNLDGYIAG